MSTGAASALLLLAGAAVAADTEQLAAAMPFEEIVVTARKREELLQAVPIAISAFTAQDLRANDVDTVQDLRYLSPSVYIQGDTFQQDTLNITIRGLRNFPSNGIQFDTATAVYENGIYFARTQGLGGTLFDIDAVQILKGPQGTLVGRNSTGGAVLYTTKEPQQGFGGYLDLTGGDYGRREAQGAINVPLSDTLAARVAVDYALLDGYLRNIYYDPASGYRNTTPGLGYQRIAAKFSVKWQPDDSFKLVLLGDAAGEHDTGTSYHDLGYFVGTVASLGRPSICNIPGTCTTSGAPAGTGFTDLLGRSIAPYYINPTTGTINPNPAAYNALLNSLAREQGNFWSIDQAVSDRNVDHFHTISGLADKTFGDIDVRLVGGYRWFDTSGTAVSRGSPYDTLQNIYSVPNYKAYTSDLTVNGNAFANRMKWTTGLFFFKESAVGGLQMYLYSPNFPVPAAVSGHQIAFTDTSGNSGHNESYAAYAQATYSVLPTLRLTAGVRYTIDDRSAHISSQSARFPATPATTALVPNSVFNPGPFVSNGISYSGYSTSCSLTDAGGNLLPVNACAFNVARTFRKATWTAAVDYDLFEHTLVYATVRTGYRAGAINTAVFNPTVTVAQPENVRDYEIGIKSDWTVAGIPVRTNLDGYFTTYHNIQTQQSLPFAVFATAPGTGPGGTVGPCTQAAFNAALCTGTSNQNVTLNAKAAELYGAEWQITAKPIPSLALDFGGSYLHAKYTDFTFTVPAGYLQPNTGLTNLSGTPFPLPRWQINGAATYTLTGEELGLPVDHVSLGARWYWESKYLGNLAGYNPAQYTSNYHVISSVHLDIANVKNSKASLSAFVTNVFDVKNCYAQDGAGGAGGAGILNSVPNATFGTPGTSGLVQCVPLPPREFGVRARYEF